MIRLSQAHDHCASVHDCAEDDMAGAQGAADASRERGAGDWQHHKPPSAVLKEVAARNAQPRLGPRLPGPPPLQVPFN